MTLENPQTEYRLKRLLDVVNFYSENPITEMYHGVKFSTWRLVLSLAYPEIFKDIQSPAGINQDVLFQLKETINNQLTGTPLSEKQKENLEASIPPNMQELLDDYERYLNSQNLTSDERVTYLDDLIKRAGTANQAVFKEWEKQRLENIKIKLEENRLSLIEATKEAARNAIKLNGRDLPSLKDKEEEIANIISEELNKIASIPTEVGPKDVKDIATEAKPVIIDKIDAVIKDTEVATSITDLFLSDNTLQTIQTAGKISFTEKALTNQYEGESLNGPFPGGIIPESLQNFSDKEIALLTQQITSPYQSGLSGNELSLLQKQLFALIKSEVILPYGQIEIIAINRATQILTNSDLMSKIEFLLKNGLPQNLAKTVQSIKIDNSTIEILNAVRFSNWFFNKESKNEGNIPPGRISIQDRNGFLISFQKLEAAIHNHGTNDVFASLKTFIETNRNESWFKIIRGGSTFLPNNPQGIGYSLFSRFFKNSPEGYLSGPLSFFKTKLVNFTGSLFTKVGTKLGNKFLLGIGTKILGTALGGPIGTAAAFAPEILSLLNKSPRVRMIKKAIVIIAGGLGSLLAFALGFLGNLGAAVVTGVASGMVIGTIVGGPIGFVVGGIVGGIIGGIIGWIGQTMGGGTTTTAAASIPATSGTTSLASSISSGALTPTTMAAVPTITAIGVTSFLLVYTYVVSSTSLFVPQGEEQLLGSPHIKITKRVSVGGLQNPVNVQNTIVNEKAIYQLTIESVDIPLKDVTIVDKTTVTNKSGSFEFSDRYIAENQSGTYVFKEKITGEWNKTTDPQLQEITSGTPWNKLYGFTITNQMKDSFITNTVTVTGTNEEGGTETKTITLSFSIGTPPLSPAAQVAKNLIDRLIDCYGPNITAIEIGDGSCIQNQLKKPQGVTFKEATKNTIVTSTTVFKRLQCVGFVQAVLIESSIPLPQPHQGSAGNAADFFGPPVSSGYTWHPSSDFRNIKSGDVFVSKRSIEGHIGIVFMPNGMGFKLAEALGDSTNNGLVQYTGAQWNFTAYENDPDLGYLRFGK